MFNFGYNTKYSYVCISLIHTNEYLPLNMYVCMYGCLWKQETLLLQVIFLYACLSFCLLQFGRIFTFYNIFQNICFKQIFANWKLLTYVQINVVVNVCIYFRYFECIYVYLYVCKVLKIKWNLLNGKQIQWKNKIKENLGKDEEKKSFLNNLKVKYCWQVFKFSKDC